MKCEFQRLTVIGVLTPFVLLPYRPESDAKDVRDFVTQAFPRHKPPLEGDDLLRLVRVADPHCLAAVLKWCWARLPGGVVSWKVYNQFKEEEIKSGFPLDAFVKIVPRCVETGTHGNILFDFFDLLASIVTHGRQNGLVGRKIPRLAGTWAFDIKKPGAKESTSFADGLAAWSLAAEATNHLFFAFLRSLSVAPKPMGGGPPVLPRPLQNMLVSERDYPPEPIYKSKLVAVPMITLTVGKLSANPMVLLRRVAKTIRFDNPSVFATEDDFNTLYFLFNEAESIEYKIADESLRIIKEVINENPLVTDHPILIKDTPKLAYDVRGKTWSKFYNHAYIDPSSGELRRPLTNYVYDDDQLKEIKRVGVPSQEVKALPYPDSPDMKRHGVTSRPVLAASGEEWDNFIKKDHHILTERRSSRITADGLVTAGVSQIAISDFFVWVWMSCLSQEQTEVRKATFGRSVVVEIVVSPGERRWVVVEEILHPEPAPIKPKHEIKDRPLPRVIPRRAVSTPVTQVIKRKPVPASPVPTTPPTPPSPPPKSLIPEDQHHYHHYYHHHKKPRDLLLAPNEYLDPLVDALAKRLQQNNIISHATTPKPVKSEVKRNYVDREIQTDIPDTSKSLPSITKDLSSTTTSRQLNSTPSPPTGMVDMSVQTDLESRPVSPTPMSHQPEYNQTPRQAQEDDSKSIYYTPKLSADPFDQPEIAKLDAFDERQELENQRKEQKQLQLQLEQLQKQLQLQQLQIQQQWSTAPSMGAVAPISSAAVLDRTQQTRDIATHTSPEEPYKSVNLQVPVQDTSLSVSTTTPTLSAIQTSWLDDQRKSSDHELEAHNNNHQQFHPSSLIDKPLPTLPPHIAASSPSPPIEDLNRGQPLPPQTDSHEQARKISVKRKPVGSVESNPNSPMLINDQQQLVDSINDLVGASESKPDQMVRRQRSRTLDDSSSGGSLDGYYQRNTFNQALPNNHYYDDYDRNAFQDRPDDLGSGRLMSPFPMDRAHSMVTGGERVDPVPPRGRYRGYNRYGSGPSDLEDRHNRPVYDDRSGLYESNPNNPRFRSNLRDSYSSGGGYVLERPYSPAPSSSASQPPHPPHPPQMRPTMLGAPTHPGDIRSFKKKTNLRNNLDSFESPFFGRENRIGGQGAPSHGPTTHGPPPGGYSGHGGPPSGHTKVSWQQQERERSRGYGRPGDRGFSRPPQERGFGRPPPPLSHPYAEMVADAPGQGQSQRPGPPIRPPISQLPLQKRPSETSLHHASQLHPPNETARRANDLTLEPPKIGLLQFEKESDPSPTSSSAKPAPVPPPGPTPGHTPAHSEDSSFLAQTNDLANTDDSGLENLNGLLGGVNDSRDDMTTSSTTSSSSAAQWTEVKENLKELRQSFGQNNIMPPIISDDSYSSDKGRSAQSLISGLAAPDDYYDAIVSTVRKPSIHTGDHVKALTVKVDEVEGFSEHSSRSTPNPSTGQDDYIYNSSRLTYEGQYLKSGNSPYRPAGTPNCSSSSLPGNKSRPESGNLDNSLPKSRPVSGSFDNNSSKRGSLPSSFDPLNEHSVYRASRAGLLDSTKMSPGETKVQSDEKVSKYSIVGIINAAKRKSQQ